MFGRSAAAARPVGVSVGLSMACTPKEAWPGRVAPALPRPPPCSCAWFLASIGGDVMQAVDYDAAQFEQGSEMSKGPDVSEIVEQIKARLKQIEDQFGQHQRLADELERVRDVAKHLERAVVARITGDQAPSATGPTAATTPRRAARPTSVANTTAPARAPRGQNKAKILDALKGRVPMTASQIADVTSIPAATVSSTLTKMAKTGELRKAERGYTLP
jgi:CRP-like cAMP-binding protein